MSRLAREELRHFEQVRKIMLEREIEFQHVPASRYASSLRKLVRDSEPYKLLDILIISALIEARSCERFASIIAFMPDDLSKFYNSLVISEARHFEHYLKFARDEVKVDNSEYLERLNELKAVESKLIISNDKQFGFHSGMPV